MQILLREQLNPHLFEVVFEDEKIGQVQQEVESGKWKAGLTGKYVWRTKEAAALHIAARHVHLHGPKGGK